MNHYNYSINGRPATRAAVIEKTKQAAKEAKTCSWNGKQVSKAELVREVKTATIFHKPFNLTISK